MKKIKNLAIISIIAFIAISCQKRPDIESLRAEILKQHQEFIKAHHEKNAALIAKPTSSNYLSISNGEVRKMDAESMESMLSPYLEETEFAHYYDLEEPIIKISQDGSMAWGIFQVRVAGTRTLADSSSRSYDIQWAWVTLYERKGNEWIKTADISTNKLFTENP